VNAFVRTAEPSDLEQMVQLLDQQFVFGAARTISLTQRFPAVYCEANAANLFLIEERGTILSCLASKCFSVVHMGNRWRGIMIGGVYTHPQRRGEGLASRLLEQSVETLRERGMDFAVLWAVQPAFYARLGWTSADSGVLGEFRKDTGFAVPAGEITRTPAPEIECGYIERIRRRWCACLTPRRAEDYRQLPLPATSVDLLSWGTEAGQSAYALVGSNGDMNILYELIGHPDGFRALWNEACRGGRQILANDASDSISHRWLAQNTGLVWRKKPLTMWLPLSAKIDMAQFAHWHIPYFDRI